MELAIFPAGIDARRQVIDETLIEFTAGEGAIELPRIDAREACLEPAVDHVVREIPGGFRLPKRKDRFESRPGEAVLAVLAHVTEEQIAERDVREAGRHEAVDCRPHDRLIL